MQAEEDLLSAHREPADLFAEGLAYCPIELGVIADNRDGYAS
jgi:hypothetical protein